jgi:cytosine/adenosine deaminase-related metal-dependent hydrolase
VTAVGDIAPPDFPWDDLPDLPSGGVLFGELIAPTKDYISVVRDFAHTIAARSEGDSRSSLAPGESPGAKPPWRIGLSPHASYTVHPALLDDVVKLSVEKKIPLAMHLAESPEELQLLAEQAGPLRRLLEERGVWDPSAFSSPRRPMDSLQMLAAAHHTLIIHGNYLQDDEIAFLARHPDRFSVVYCPRSHAWFRHEPYPLEKLLAAGVNVALGTDGRASAPDLSLLAEMQFVARNFPQIPKEVILQLGTLNGARALGLDQELGSLKPGKWANLAVLSLSESTTDSLQDLIFKGEALVMDTWYRGRRVFSSL